MCNLHQISPGAVSRSGLSVEIITAGGGVKPNMNKDGFIIYKSFFPALEHLTDTQMGRLFRAIFRYQINGTAPDAKDDIFPYFGFFKGRFDADEEAYNETCRLRAEAAHERWEKERRQKAQTETNAGKSGTPRKSVSLPGPNLRSADSRLAIPDGNHEADNGLFDNKK